jgi:hypothetical protein
MKVSVRSEKVKLPKGKNEDEREPESEEVQVVRGPRNELGVGGRSCNNGTGISTDAAIPPSSVLPVSFPSTLSSRPAHNWCCKIPVVLYAFKGRLISHQSSQRAPFSFSEKHDATHQFSLQ